MENYCEILPSKNSFTGEKSRRVFIEKGFDLNMKYSVHYSNYKFFSINNIFLLFFNHFVIFFFFFLLKASEQAHEKKKLQTKMLYLILFSYSVLEYIRSLL